MTTVIFINQIHAFICGYASGFKQNELGVRGVDQAVGENEKSRKVCKEESGVVGQLGPSGFGWVCTTIRAE
jgi:hypothetical protein